MSAIFKPVADKFRVLFGEKTVYPVLRFLPPGKTGEDFAPGELVGVQANAGLSVVAAKITAGNQYTQAKHAAMRINQTSNDVMQSNGITVNEGYYVLQTQMYLPATYTLGQVLTLRYDSTNDRGVFGAVDGSTTDVIAHVHVPPADGSANDPMVLKVYSTPVPKV